MEGTTISPVDRTIIEEEHLRHYTFQADYTDPLEEFRMPNNLFSDHTLYVLTHSPNFQNLRVIDLRGNPLNSLKTLKINSHQFQAPSLEELYIETEANKHSENVSFIFTGINDILKNLKTLWIDSNSSSTYIKREFESEIIDKLKYKKLFLRNITFVDDLIQDLLYNLEECEELTFKRCSFELYKESDCVSKINDSKEIKPNFNSKNANLKSKIKTNTKKMRAKSNIDEDIPAITLDLSKLKSLRYLSIEKSKSMVASLCKSKNLQNSLRSLTISDVYFPNILKSMPKFRYLTHLSLVKITISRPTFKSSPLVLPSSLLSLCIKDCALCPNSFFPVQVQQLSLLSNSYALLSSKLGFDLPNHPLTKSLTFDDSLLALLPESYPSLVQKFPGLKKLCYFKCAGLEQIKHKIQLPADPLKCLFEAASKKSCPPKVTVIDNPPKIIWLIPQAKRICTQELYDYTFDFDVQQFD